MPINLLIFTQENRPETPYVIKNRDEMVEYFKKMFFEFNRGVSSEGETEFTNIIDGFFDEAIESGELWIDNDERWFNK